MKVVLRYSVLFVELPLCIDLCSGHVQVFDLVVDFHVRLGLEEESTFVTRVHLVGVALLVTCENLFVLD